MRLPTTKKPKRQFIFSGSDSLNPFQRPKKVYQDILQRDILKKRPLIWAPLKSCPIDDFYTASFPCLSCAASIPTLAMIPASVLGGIVGQWLGRRTSMLLLAPFSIAGFACQVKFQFECPRACPGSYTPWPLVSSTFN